MINEIARLYNFEDGKVAHSSPVNEELNQLVAAHNQAAGVTNIIETEAGAAHVGAVPLKEGGANTVQGQLEELKAESNAAITAHTTRTDNPHEVTKAQVGLSDADNTADNVKNVLSATRLTTPRQIGAALFDGSANISLSEMGAYTKTELQNSGQSTVHWNNLTNVPNFGDPHWKSPVANRAALPLSGNALQDTRTVLDDGDGKQAIYTCVATSGNIDAQWNKIADVDWMAEEATRVAQENARVVAENGRVTAETGRHNAEVLRASAESARVVSENARQSAETIRGNNETSRINAESARYGAEATRVAQENARVTAENARKVFEEYSNVKAYVVGNKVFYQGSSYVCISNTTAGTMPTDISKWIPIALKGEAGLPTSVNGVVQVDGNITLTAADVSGALTVVDILNSLTSTATDKSLSAAQGKALNDLISTNTSKIEDRYTELEAVQKFAYLEEKTGNSVQITDTIAAELAEMELLGETTQRRVAFTGGQYVDLINGGTWPFANGASLTFSGLDSTASANNKTATVTTVSGTRLTFPASTFSASGVSLNGTITDGTNTVHITVSPDHSQTLDSLHSFDYRVNDGNVLRKGSLNADDLTVTTNITKNSDGSFTMTGNGTSDKKVVFGNASKYLKPNKVYSVLIDIESVSVTGDINITTPGVTNPWTVEGYMSLTKTTGRQKKLLTTKADLTGCYSLFIGFAYTNELGSCKFKLMMFEGDVDINTPYQEGTFESANVELKDTSDNQLEARGIPATYNPDGSVSTWAARDNVFKDTDGLWKLLKGTYKSVIDSSTDIRQIYDTEANDYIITYYLINKTYVPTAASNGDQYTICNLFKVNSSVSSVPTKNTLARHNGYWTFLIGVPKNALTGYAYSLTDAEKIQLIKNYFGITNCIVYTNTTEAGKTLTELHPDNQAALNEIAHSFDGQTNIMLGSDVGEVKVKCAKNTEVLKDKSGTLATRPAAGQRIGQVYVTTDETGGEKAYLWTGTTWLPLN